jgi:hypothetical protein
MNKHKAILAFAIALLSLVHTAGFCFESVGLLEKKKPAQLTGPEA